MIPTSQQIIPPALVSEIITSLHNPATAGHLGTYKTIEKYDNPITGQDLRRTSKNIFAVAIAARSEQDLHGHTGILLPTGRLVTRSTTLGWTFLDPFRYPITVNMFC